MFRWPDRTIGVVALVGLAIRLCFVFIIDVAPDTGEFPYQTLAVQGGVGAGYAPLYPLFLRLAYTIFKTSFYYPVYLIQAVASTFVVLLLYAAVSRIGGRRAGLTAAIISALYPGFILYNRGILIETWSVLLVAAMMTVANGPTRDLPRACMQGILTGVGVLLKPAFLFFIPGFLITVRKRLIYSAACCAILIPLIVHNSVVSREFVPMYRKSAYDFTLQPSARSALRAFDVIYVNLVRLYVWHPGQGTHSNADAQITAIYYARKYSYLVLLLLGLIGLARCMRREHVPVALPILGAVLAPILITTVAEARFRVFLEPLLIMYASLLMGRACDGVARGGSGSEPVKQ